MTPYALFDTAISRCGVAWSARGLVAVQLPQPSDAQTLKRLHDCCGDIAEATPPEPVAAAIAAMRALLEGSKPDLSTIPLDLDGVPDFTAASTPSRAASRRARR